jgi:hypothetical protein
VETVQKVTGRAQTWIGIMSSVELVPMTLDVSIFVEMRIFLIDAARHSATAQIDALPGPSLPQNPSKSSASGVFGSVSCCDTYLHSPAPCASL